MSLQVAKSKSPGSRRLHSAFCGNLTVKSLPKVGVIPTEGLPERSRSGGNLLGQGFVEFSRSFGIQIYRYSGNDKEPELIRVIFVNSDDLGSPR